MLNRPEKVKVRSLITEARPHPYQFEGSFEHKNVQLFFESMAFYSGVPIIQVWPQMQSNLNLNNGLSLSDWKGQLCQLGVEPTVVDRG